MKTIRLNHENWNLIEEILHILTNKDMSDNEKFAEIKKEVFKYRSSLKLILDSK